MRISKKRLKKESKCPNCKNRTLTLIKTTKENAGTERMEHFSRGLMWGRMRLIRETRYFKCTNCGYETYLISKCAE